VRLVVRRLLSKVSCPPTLLPVFEGIMSTFDSDSY